MTYPALYNGAPEDAIPGIHRFVSLKMLMNYAQAFSVLTADLEKLQAQVLIYAHGEKNDHLTVNSTRVAEFRVIVSQLLATCQQVPQLDRMTGPIGRFLAAIDQGLDSNAFYHQVKFVQLQLFDELERMKLYHVSENLVPLYENPQPFGELVFNAFPSAVLDSQNAGKCLALGQATAAMFHLMRVMEHGLSAYAKSLGISYMPSWEAYTDHIKAKLGIKWDQKDKKWKAAEAFHKQILGDLTSIRIAWRNPTVHIVNDYSDNEALTAYLAVQGFMQHLVAHKIKEGRRTKKSA